VLYGTHLADVAPEDMRSINGAIHGDRPLQLDREIGDTFRASRTYGRRTRSSGTHPSRFGTDRTGHAPADRAGAAGSETVPSTKNEPIFVDRRFVFFPNHPSPARAPLSRENRAGIHEDAPLDFRSYSASKGQ